MQIKQRMITNKLNEKQDKEKVKPKGDKLALPNCCNTLQSDKKEENEKGNAIMPDDDT